MPNPCKNVCSHLCLLRPGGYTCACPQGSSPVQFDSNECDAGKKCSPCVFSLPPQEPHPCLEVRLFLLASFSVFINPSVVFTSARLPLCGLCETCGLVVVDSVCAWLLAPAAIEPLIPMPLACRCMNGGTCYTEGDLPKCK